MAEKKVTTMVIKVDLSCEKCRKKIKKVLCKIPQIQNQVYDEKANTVTITVVCCSPEKIKKKICCKGGDSVKGIEIKVPEKPKPKEKPKESPKPEKPKDPEPPPKKPEPAPAPPPKAPEPAPAPPPKAPEPAPAPPPKAPEPAPAPPPKAPEPAPAPPPKAPAPAPAPPPKAPAPAPAPPPKAPEPGPECLPPVRTCCMECYEGRGGGPCYHGFGRPPPCYEGYGNPAPPPCYEVYGRPVYDSWGGGGYYGGCRRGCYVGRCDCLSEENPAGCIVM